MTTIASSLSIMTWVLSGLLATSAQASPKCSYPLHIDIVQSATGNESENSKAKAIHADGCVDETARWSIINQNDEHVLLAQVRSATGLPRLAIVLMDATLQHTDLSCEQIIERDKEKLCDAGSADRSVKFKVLSTTKK